MSCLSFISAGSNPIPPSLQCAGQDWTFSVSSLMCVCGVSWTFGRTSGLFIIIWPSLLVIPSHHSPFSWLVQLAAGLCSHAAVLSHMASFLLSLWLCLCIYAHVSVAQITKADNACHFSDDVNSKLILTCVLHVHSMCHVSMYIWTFLHLWPFSLSWQAQFSLACILFLRVLNRQTLGSSLGAGHFWDRTGSKATGDSGGKGQRGRRGFCRRKKEEKEGRRGGRRKEKEGGKVCCCPSFIWVWLALVSLSVVAFISLCGFNHVFQPYNLCLVSVHLVCLVCEQTWPSSVSFIQFFLTVVAAFYWAFLGYVSCVPNSPIYTCHVCVTSLCLRLSLTTIWATTFPNRQGGSCFCFLSSDRQTWWWCSISVPVCCFHAFSADMPQAGSASCLLFLTFLLNAFVRVGFVTDNIHPIGVWGGVLVAEHSIERSVLQHFIPSYLGQTLWAAGASYHAVQGRTPQPPRTGPLDLLVDRTVGKLCPDAPATPPQAVWQDGRQALILQTPSRLGWAREAVGTGDPAGCVVASGYLPWAWTASPKLICFAFNINNNQSCPSPSSWFYLFKHSFPLVTWCVSKTYPSLGSVVWWPLLLHSMTCMPSSLQTVPMTPSPSP